MVVLYSLRQYPLLAVQHIMLGFQNDHEAHYTGVNSLSKANQPEKQGKHCTGESNNERNISNHFLTQLCSESSRVKCYGLAMVVVLGWPASCTKWNSGNIIVLHACTSRTAHYATVVGLTATKWCFLKDKVCPPPLYSIYMHSVLLIFSTEYRR